MNAKYLRNHSYHLRRIYVPKHIIMYDKVERPTMNVCAAVLLYSGKWCVDHFASKYRHRRDAQEVLAGTYMSCKSIELSADNDARRIVGVCMTSISDINGKFTILLGR